MSESIGLGANVGTAWVALRFSARGASTQIRSQLRGETAALGSDLGASTGDNFKSSFGKRIDGLGASVKNALVPLTKYGALGLAAIGVESIRMATSFQSSMLKIRTQAGATQSEVNKMSGAILSMATHSQQGPDQLAAALYHLESLGLRGAKSFDVLSASSLRGAAAIKILHKPVTDGASALDALRTAMQLSAVSGADLEETTNAIGGAWRTGIKGAKSFTQSAATLNAVVGAGNMRMADLLGALGTGILPTAKTFGLTLRDVGSAIALFTDEGVPAVDAATRLRMSFSLLGAPSKSAEKVLESIGLSGTKLATAMRGPHGLISAIQLIHDHLEGLSKVDQAQILSRAFGGGRSSASIMSMINNLDVLKMKYKQVGEGTSQFSKDVAAQAKTASAQWHELVSELDVMAIKLGTDLLPLAQKFAHFLTSTFIPDAEKLARWIASPSVRPWAEFVGRLLVAAAAARTIFNLLSKIGKITGLSRVFQASTSQAASATVATASTNMRSAAGTMLQASLNMLKAAGLEADATTASGSGAAGKVIGGAAGASWLSRIKSGAGMLGLAVLIDQMAIKPLLKGMPSGPGGKNWWDNPFGQSNTGSHPGFLASWAPLEHWFSNSLPHAIEKTWDTAYQTFMHRVGSPVADFFSNVLPSVIGHTIPHWYSNAQAWFAKDVYNPVNTWFNVSVPHGFAYAWDTGYQTFMHRIGSPVTHWFTVSLPHGVAAVGGSLVDTGRRLVGGFMNGILSIASGIKSWITAHVVTPVTSRFGSSGSWLIADGQDIIAGLLNGILDRMKGIGSWIWANVAEPVIGWIKHHFGIHSPSVVMHGIGFNLIAGLLRGIITANPLGLIKDVFSDLPGALAHLVESGVLNIAKLPGKLLGMLGTGFGDLGHFVSGLFGGGGSVPGGSALAIGQALSARAGWTGANWSALEWLWNRESGWRWNALNPSSGAYGIPQALPASKMAAAGSDWRTNPATQIRWGLAYIRSVYGSPLNAAAHERRFNWYDLGGIASGIGFMPKNTPKPERVLSPQQTMAFERLVDVLDGRTGGSSRPLQVTDGRVEFDPRKMEMWVRDLSVQEARAEIAFNGG